MAECLIITGVDCVDCSEKFALPGILKDKIYVGNFSEITSFTDGALPMEISAITFDTYAGLFAICSNRNSASFTEELQVSETSGNFYNQTLTFRIIDSSSGTLNAINQMVGVALTFVIKDKNGVWKVLGETEGLQMSEQTGSTGAVAGDEMGDLLTFTGVNKGKARKFFDTDAATTETTLDGYLLPNP